MGITYTWKITRLEVVDQGDLKDVAIQSCFDVYGEDEEGHKGFAQGDVLLGTPNPDTFTDISSVTHEQAIAWTKAALPNNGADFETRVAEQIGWQKQPKPKAAELSWITTESE